MAISTFTDWTEDEFAPADRHAEDLAMLLDQLVEITGRLRA